MNTEGFVPHSVELTIDPCSQPNKFHAHPSTLFPETALKIILPFMHGILSSLLNRNTKNPFYQFN